MSGRIFLTLLAAYSMLAACAPTPRADLVRVGWGTPAAITITDVVPTSVPFTPTTTTTTTTTSIAATPPPATVPSTVQAFDPRLVAAMQVPSARLSWPCRTDGTPGAVLRRHDAFVHNIDGSGLPASSRRQVLAQLPAIEQNLDLYCISERLTGVPALVLAAIHYREANNDPTRSIMSGEPIGAVNPDTHRVEGATTLDNALAAAEHLERGAAEIYGVTVSRRMNVVDLAYAIAAYNRGGRYCRADQMHPMRSPYVAAGLVDDNVGMIWPDVGSDDGGPESWGEPPSVRGRPDHRLGVLALMRGLGSEITATAFSWDTDEVVIRCR